MFEEKILEIKATINELNETIENQRLDIVAQLDADNIEAAEKIKSERDAKQNELIAAENQLKLYEAAIQPNVGNNSSTKTVVVTNGDTEYRNSINKFIRSKGGIVDGLKTDGKDEIVVPYKILNATTPIDPVADGVKKADTQPVTSDEIIYNPEREVKTIVDLKQFTKIQPANKAKGSYPILKEATTRMYGVDELEKNPKLSKPEFENIDWEVKTYRGAIPLSQESIDDADVDLVAIVQENVNEIKLNTSNYAIAEAMKTFTPKTITDFDDIKRIYNVDLDAAYNKSFVVTQSFYNFIDTLKDGNGRYLLQDSITSASGKVFGSFPVFIVNDELLGAKEEAHAFIGDIKRAILFADRKNLGLRWMDHDIYGQYLQAVTRFDVKVADTAAGYFATYTPTP